MKIIAHRGNLNGADSSKENTIDYIKLAIQEGFDVEIDLWVVDNRLFLGHDFAQHELLDASLLADRRVWVHAKNLEALHHLISNFPYSNFFWHQNDDFTLTSKKWIWTYPGKKVCGKSIIVSLDGKDFQEVMSNGAYGMCTDHPMEVRKLLETYNLEKKYNSYVELCVMESYSPISFFSFIDECQNNNRCEYCLILNDTLCACKK